MEIVAIAAGGITSLIVTIVGFISANKLGIGTSQLQLVSTLKDLVKAQSDRIDQLEEDNKLKDEQIAELQSEVADLKAVVLKLNLKSVRGRGRTNA